MTASKILYHINKNIYIAYSHFVLKNVTCFQQQIEIHYSNKRIGKMVVVTVVGAEL